MAHRRPARRRAAAILACSGVLILVALSAPTNAAASTLVTFSCTGAAQSWTVPSGVTTITVDALGAQGGTGAGTQPGTGGLGGETSTTISVTPGEALQLNVGCRGGDAGTPNTYTAGVGGFNAGTTAGDGNGGTNGSGGNFGGGAGGGASDVRQGGTALSNRVVVAGGGGGGAAGPNGFSGGTGGNGGTGGGVGSNGAPNTVSSSSPGGHGGTQSTGGAAGDSFGTAGSLGRGGVGGANNCCTGGGGGGGGGAYGGGGGGVGGNAGAAGGGGGSCLGPTGATFTGGVRSGAGALTITYTASAPVVPIPPTGVSVGTSPSVLALGGLAAAIGLVIVLGAVRRRGAPIEGRNSSS